jgi:hypothetical protein
MLRDTARLPQNSPLLSRLEKFDRIAVRVLQQDLLTARAGLHLIAKMKSRRFQILDPRGEIGDFKNDPIPPAGLLAMSARHRTRARRAAEPEVVSDDWFKA